MKVASLNTNKRLGSDAARRRVETWLHDRQVDLFIAQEGWKPPDRTPPPLLGFEALGGTDKSHAWIRPDLSKPQLTVHEPYWISLYLSKIMIHSVYLDAYKQTSRALQIDQIRCRVAADETASIILGDFNLAPLAIDGLSGDVPSRFNSETDRGPFRQLLADAGLVDVGARDPVHYTIERTVGQTSTRFRCDLVLVSRHLATRIAFETDDTPRQDGFSDHSALLVDLPFLRVPAAQRPRHPEQLGMFPEVQPALGEAAHKTAMGRAEPSAPAARLARPLIGARCVRSVLDFGCGRGRDVTYYKEELGLDAHGYDPHAPFGFSTLPERQFDLVTVVFVLNVIPNPEERLEILRLAASRLRPNGYMLVVTRSKAEIETQAGKRGWATLADGYMSDPRKNTFQRGFTPEELLELGHQVGLREPKDRMPALPDLHQASHAVLTPAGSAA